MYGMSLIHTVDHVWLENKQWINTLDMLCILVDMSNICWKFVLTLKLPLQVDVIFLTVC